tara:strand:+ start:3674 stop:3862 length:189 start_codon:yes stop_codon:yes gene_type:complete
MMAEKVEDTITNLLKDRIGIISATTPILELCDISAICFFIILCYTKYRGWAVGTELNTSRQE